MAACPYCHFDNPAGFRFCGNCGRALQSDLPKVPPFISSPLYHPSQALSPDAFQRLQSAAKELRGERRNVAVLFADLCNYTRYSQHRDPEEVFATINRYLGVMIEQIYRYEGVIDKFTGDGVMALFGAPLAHENDAERAVRACIGIQVAVGELNHAIRAETGAEIQVRLGVHFGSVVFGQVGINVDETLSVLDYTAIGDTVNLASRLEQAAKPGGALVSEAILQRTKALFEFEPTPDLALKGYAEPVPAFSIVGLKAKPGRVRGLEDRQAPMVGRHAELEQVITAVRQVSGGTTGRILLVTGEAGLGKSRLSAEVKQRIEPHEISLLEGGSLSYRSSVSYWTFREILHRYFDFQDDNSVAHRQRKIRRRLAELGDHLTPAAPVLELLLSIPPADPEAAARLQQLDAEQLRQQTFVTLHDLFLAEARRRPLMLILEDLHWADRLSLDLIRFLMDVVPQAPLLLFCISRPVDGGVAQLLSEHAQPRYPECFVAVPLRPLSASQSDELLDALLAIPHLPGALRNTISGRAEGNPFYLEETIRMLIARGILRQVEQRWEPADDSQFDQLDVPDTLQGLVMARFDRLPDDLRQVLQVASVIGFRFPFRLLSVVLGHAATPEQLVELSQQDFVVEQEGQTDLTYTFRHAITAETIHNSILRQQRAVIHGQVAQAIEQLYRGRLTEQVETLANHYSHSHHPERALHYLIRAGQKAARSFANVEALDYLTQARKLQNKGASTFQQQVDVLEGMGDVLIFTGEYDAAQQRYREAVEVLRQAAGSDYLHLGELERKVADTLTRQGNYDQALISLAGALRYVQSEDERKVVKEKAQICSDIGWVHLRRGNAEQANAWLQRGLQWVENSPHQQVIASIYNRLGGVAFQDGDWPAAGRWLGKSLKLQQQLGDLAGMARSHNNLGVMAARQGQYDQARRNLARSLELRSQIGDTEGVLSIYLNLGAVLINLGELNEAERALSQALDIAQRIGHSFYEGMTHLNLGRLWTTSQEWEKAIQHLQSSTAVLEEIGAQDDLIDAHYFLGEAWFGLGNLDQAEQWAQSALDLTRQLGSKALSKSFQQGRCYRLLGCLAREQGRLDEAANLLHSSVAIYQALDNRQELGKSYSELASLAHRQQDRQLARTHLKKALAIFRDLGARLEEEKVQQALLGLDT